MRGQFDRLLCNSSGCVHHFAAVQPISGELCRSADRSVGSCSCLSSEKLQKERERDNGVGLLHVFSAGTAQF